MDKDDENVEASEPLGEGDGDIESDGGGGQHYVDLLLFVEIRIFDLDFDRATHFLTPSRVELIGKTSILRLETTTNR